MASPANEELPDMPKLFSWKSFGENVGLLFRRLDVLGDDPVGLANVGSKEVILQRQIFVLVSLVLKKGTMSQIWWDSIIQCSCGSPDDNTVLYVRAQYRRTPLQRDQPCGWSKLENIS